jgi:hypothetical protein
MAISALRMHTVQEAACDPEKFSVGRLYYSMKTGEKSTNSRETTTEKPMTEMKS